MERKVLIKKIEEYFGVKPKYLGAPSFAYELAIGHEVFTILKDGKIKSSSGNFISFEELTRDEPNESIQLMSKDDVIGEFEVTLPLKDHTGKTLLNVVNMLASKQNLLMPALELNTLLVEEQFFKALNEQTINSLEEFEEQYRKAGPEHCPGLSINFVDGLLTFRIRGDHLDVSKIRAFSDLAVLINKNGKLLSRTLPRPAQITNPKYALRTWLIRLGMSGKEFKEARKVLLANLKGNSAYAKHEEVMNHEA